MVDMLRCNLVKYSLTGRSLRTTIFFGKNRVAA